MVLHYTADDTFSTCIFVSKQVLLGGGRVSVGELPTPAKGIAQSRSSIVFLQRQGYMYDCASWRALVPDQNTCQDSRPCPGGGAGAHLLGEGPSGPFCGDLLARGKLKRAGRPFRSNGGETREIEVALRLWGPELALVFCSWLSGPCYRCGILYALWSDQLVMGCTVEIKVKGDGWCLSSGILHYHCVYIYYQAS